MTFPHLISRAGPRSVALETTLLLHGVPHEAARPLATDIRADIERHGAHAALVGVVAGRPTVGLTDTELDELLIAPRVPKANTANLGAILFAGSHGATTVSTTIELAAGAGVRVFATGGLGGVHKHLARHLDISSDLTALARFPVAVVASGCKSLLDVVGTRELLETLGVPVVGFRTDRFPAFYLRESDATIDARFDDAAALAQFVRSELARTGRGIVIANPIPEADEIPHDLWMNWLDAAEEDAERATGRDVTPVILGRLHELSGGRTLRANITLVRNNASLAAQIASTIAGHDSHA